MIRTPIALAILSLALPAVAADAPYAPGACSLVPNSQTCVDASPCKTIATGQTVCLAGVPPPTGAYSVSQSCWKYTYTFACDAPAAVNTCTPFENNPACSVTASICTDHKPESGKCTSWNFTYKCMTKPAETTNQLECSSTLFDTSSMPTPANPNNSFVKAALAMEIARQTQVYAEPNKTVFNGIPESCTKGYWGLHNCCTGTPGAMSNRGFVKNIAGNAAFGVVKYAGEKIVDVASPYVFDAMYSNAEYFSSGVMMSISTAEHVVMADAEGWGEAIGTNFASQGVTLSAYGFTYGTGEVGATLPGTMDLSESFGLGSGEGFVTFNPYVLAAMIAIQYLMSLSECTEQEHMFQMHKGANLTVFNKETCIKDFLGSCLNYRQDYCSFNSVLAKIINIQGKTQMGRDTTDCVGLTPEEVAKLDFTNMDFSEFTGKLQDEALANTPTDIKGHYTPVMNTKDKGSTQAPGLGLAYPPGGAPTAPPPATVH
jgi:conjugal transfer mating pair stabilization protein TraN